MNIVFVLQQAHVKRAFSSISVLVFESALVWILILGEDYGMTRKPRQNEHPRCGSAATLQFST